MNTFLWNPETRMQVLPDKKAKVLYVVHFTPARGFLPKVWKIESYQEGLEFPEISPTEIFRTYSYAEANDQNIRDVMEIMAR